MAKTPILQFKRGDDFKLDLTVTDTNNITAIEAEITLLEALAAQVLVLAVDPNVSQDVIDAQTAVTNAQTAYDDSIVVDITGWTVTAMMAWCGSLIATFTITPTNEALGQFSVSAGSAVTANWVPRKYDADVQFVRPSEGKVSSQTFTIEVLKDITNG